MTCSHAHQNTTSYADPACSSVTTSSRLNATLWGNRLRSTGLPGAREGRAHVGGTAGTHVGSTALGKRPSVARQDRGNTVGATKRKEPQHMSGSSGSTRTHPWELRQPRQPRWQPHWHPPPAQHSCLPRDQRDHAAIWWHWNERPWPASTQTSGRCESGAHPRQCPGWTSSRTAALRTVSEPRLKAVQRYKAPPCAFLHHVHARSARPQCTRMLTNGHGEGAGIAPNVQAFFAPNPLLPQHIQSRIAQCWVFRRCRVRACPLSARCAPVTIVSVIVAVLKHPPLPSARWTIPCCPVRYRSAPLAVTAFSVSHVTPTRMGVCRGT